MSDLKISINALCPRCKHKITEHDIAGNNYQLILLPTLTFQHQVCPRHQPNYSESSFNYPKNIPEQINLNINLN